MNRCYPTFVQHIYTIPTSSRVRIVVSENRLQEGKVTWAAWQENFQGKDWLKDEGTLLRTEKDGERAFKHAEHLWNRLVGSPQSSS